MRKICYGLLAQLVEHLLDVQRVRDSSSLPSTNEKVTFVLTTEVTFFNSIPIFGKEHPMATCIRCGISGPFVTVNEEGLCPLCQSRPQKSVSTPEFHGKIDRVDATEKYVRVIDYKTGAIDDTALSYYTGRKLQMQLYMSAIKGERIPAGVFYFPASVDYAEDTVNRFQMKGFLNGDEEALRCGDKSISEERQSEFFPASLKGTRSKRVMNESEFRDFLDYSVFVARQGCKELKEGYVAPSPYGSGCDYCKYGGMCGFQRDVQERRVEATIEPSAIAKIAQEMRDGKEE